MQRVWKKLKCIHLRLRWIKAVLSWHGTRLHHQTTVMQWWRRSQVRKVICPVLNYSTGLVLETREPCNTWWEGWLLTPFILHSGSRSICIESRAPDAHPDPGPKETWSQPMCKRFSSKFSIQWQPKVTGNHNFWLTTVLTVENPCNDGDRP